MVLACYGLTNRHLIVTLLDHNVFDKWISWLPADLSACCVVISAPYHPASNGFAERFIQTLKHNLKAAVKEGKTMHHWLAEFLVEYRVTLRATTNMSPSELPYTMHCKLFVVDKFCDFCGLIGNYATFQWNSL